MVMRCLNSATAKKAQRLRSFSFYGTRTETQQGKEKALVLIAAKIWLSSIISTKLIEPKAKRVIVEALPPKAKNKLSAWPNKSITFYFKQQE